MQETSGKSYDQMMTEYSRKLILDALTETNWNFADTASKLKISRRRLLGFISNYNLKELAPDSIKYQTT